MVTYLPLLLQLSGAVCAVVVVGLVFGLAPALTLAAIVFIGGGLLLEARS